MNKNPLAEHDTETIEREVKKIRRDIDHHERRITERREYLRRLEDELDRRNLEAFWSAHPGLRLEIGDKLLVTNEAVQWINTITPVWHIWRKDDVVDVVKIGEDFIDLLTNRPAFHFNVPLDIARRMREAWLVQESEKAK